MALSSSSQAPSPMIKLLHSRTVGCQVFANLLSRLLGTLLGGLYKGEYHECQISLKLTSRLLQLHHLLCGVHAIERLYGLLCSLADQCFNIHLFQILGAKVRISERKTKFIWVFPSVSIFET